MITVVDLFDILRSLRQFNRSVILADICRGFYTVIVHMFNLCIGHINIQTSKSINNRSQRVEVYCCIICNVQVHIPVQHAHCFCRTFGISCIGFRIGFTINIQKCVSVYRCKLYILGIIIHTCNDHSITVHTAHCTFISVVNTKQSISSETCQLGCFRLNRFLYFLIHLDLAGICRRLLYLIHFGIQLSVNIKTANKQKEYDNLYCKQYLLCF